MMLDSWIFAVTAEWDALVVDEQPFSYTHTNAQTGYWKPFGQFEVYNVVGSPEQVQAIVDALTTPGPVYSWTQGDGLDSPDTNPTAPDNVLAVMRDHVTYDENGDEASRTPATFENPNWGHIFLGQQTRVFAGEYSDDFAVEYF